MWNWSNLCRFRFSNIFFLLFQIAILILSINNIMDLNSNSVWEYCFSIIFRNSIVCDAMPITFYPLCIHLVPVVHIFRSFVHIVYIQLRKLFCSIGKTIIQGIVHSTHSLHSISLFKSKLYCYPIKGMMILHNW